MFRVQRRNNQFNRLVIKNLTVSCADPESFVRVGLAQLWQRFSFFFFSWTGRRVTLKVGHYRLTDNKSYIWRFACGPMLQLWPNIEPGTFVIILWIRISIAKELYSCVLFRERVRTLCPPFGPRMNDVPLIGTCFIGLLSTFLRTTHPLKLKSPYMYRKNKVYSNHSRQMTNIAATRI